MNNSCVGIVGSFCSGVDTQYLPRHERLTFAMKSRGQRINVTHQNIRLCKNIELVLSRSTCSGSGLCETFGRPSVLLRTPRVSCLFHTSQSSGLLEVQRRRLLVQRMLRRGLDIRYVVTSLKNGSAEHVYDAIYCARGQAENLIKQHKAQTASDRTSCRSPLANQFRLILHTAAYWLLLDVRDQVPSWHPLRQSEFTSIRLHLLKIAGRIIETASRIRVALASCCPEAELFSLIAFRLQPSGP